MKELSIKEKAQRYDEALKRTKKLYEQGTITESFSYVFPELKEESEDDKIRKRIIQALHGDVLDIDEISKCTAWLEKQGGHANFRNAIQIGDKVTRNEDGILVNLSQLKRVAKKAEKQGEIFTKKDVDDAYLKGVTDTKNEIEKQYKANYQIRKDIATFLFNYRGDIKDRTKWMDYLGIKVHIVEEQGEQKPIIEMKSPEESLEVSSKEYNEIINECLYGKSKSSDKTEPKFHKGDWIMHQGTENIYQVIACVDNYYQLKYGDNYTVQKCADVDRNARLWNIKDAKDGDVLATLDYILIFEKLLPKNGGVSHCHYDFGSSTPQFNFNKDDNWYFGKEAKVCPATEEQRDTLIKVMNKAGYIFDFGKKELKKLI